MAGTRTAAAATLIVLAGASLCGPLMAQSAGAASAPVVTTCTLLLGRPAGGAAPGAAPNRQPVESASQGPLSGPNAGRASKDLVQLSDRLRASFNLATMELSASVSAAMSLNQEVSALGTGGFRLLVTPTAIGGKEVTYQVRVLRGARAVLDKAMVVERGHRTMFAKQTGNDGETAFVVIEVQAAAEQSASALQKRPDLPAFRASVTLVPIDVRVVGRDGRLVTDLGQEDFAVLEDGVPQKIAHFLPYELQGGPVETGDSPRLRQAPTDSISPDMNRVFLIVLGRGRLQEPFKGVDALIGFVRGRLPQDRVAVIAYDRATDFTTDREAIVRLLERFKSGHEYIEQGLRQTMGGFPPWYNPRGIPREIQQLIDKLLVAPGLPQTRQIPSSGGPGFQDIIDEMRTNLWDLFGSRATSLARDRVLDAELPVEVSRRLDRWSPSSAGSWGGSDTFMRSPGRGSVETMNLERIFAGIEFMRYLAGEKHLVFVTDRNVVFPRMEYDNAIAAMANDAGVTIDTIQTGGLIGPLVHSSLRDISELTGGLSSTFRYPREGVDRLDQTTRFKYVLGYHPSNPARDGRYRKVAVRVTRPDVTVLFRHGYYASDVLVPADRRAFVAYRRIFAAGQSVDSITDIGLSVKVSAPRKGAAGPAETVITGTIDPTRVAFTKTADRFTGSLDLAAFCTDARETLLGEAWQKIDLNLTEATFRRLMREGIPYSIRVPVQAQPRWSKVIVYDYASDLLGSVAVELR